MADVKAIVERLRKMRQTHPVQGGGHLGTATGHTYITDTGFRLVNPDGPEAADTIEALQAKVEQLEANNARLLDALGQHGGRYWEARYRDESIENTKLRGILESAIQAYWGLVMTELSASEVGGGLAKQVMSEGYGLHLKLAMNEARQALGEQP